MNARLFAAKTAARLLLIQLWDRRADFLSDDSSPVDILHAAPELAARMLGIAIEHVPSIAGGTEIAGVLDRTARRIQITTSFPFPSQRFTFAHELGHWSLHTANNYFRDRSLSAPGGDHRPYYEIEADAFAAEFLIPRKHLTNIFYEIFPVQIQAATIDQNYVEAVSAGKRQRWTVNELKSATPIERAKAVASAGYFGGRHFIPLMDYFKVSKTALAIQLLHTGLVS